MHISIEEAQRFREDECQRFLEELQLSIYRFEDDKNIPKEQSMATLAIIVALHLRKIGRPHIEYVLADLHEKYAVGTAENDRLLGLFFFDTLLPAITEFQESEEEGRVTLADLLVYMTNSFLTDIRSDFNAMRLGLQGD